MMDIRRRRVATLGLVIALVGIFVLGLFAQNAARAVAEPQESATTETAEISYLYVEEAALSPNQEQSIVVSFSEQPNLSDAHIILQDEAGNVMYVPATNLVGDAILFSHTFTEDEMGTYAISALSFSHEGTVETVSFLDLGIDASFVVAAPTQSTLSSDGETSVVTLTDDDVETGDASAAVEETISETLAQMPSTLSDEKSDDDGDFVIVLDPGHGGRDPGAGGFGLSEADLTLKIAKYLKAELDKYAGVKVYLTRTTDTDFCSGTSFIERDDLQGRVDFAEEHDADVFVCLHLNAGGGKGAMVFYPNKNGDKDNASSEGKKLAEEIQDELVALGLVDNGVIKYNTEFYVIRECKKIGIPAVLVEHCYLDNSSDVSRFLTSESGLKKLALADARGIIQAYGLTKETWVKPVIYDPTASNAGPKISWKSVKGATGYAVYRKPEGGEWKMIDTTETTSYVDRSELTPGKTYRYTVRAFRETLEEALANKYDTKYWTTFDSTGAKVLYQEVPELTKATTASGGVKVQWEKSSGADGYAVYRRSGDGDWKMIGTTSSTSYTDKDGLKGSSSYEYTVRAYHGSSKTALANKYNALYWSGYDSSGITAVYHLSPTLSSVTGSGAGRKVSWKAVSGASGYAVYRKPSGGDWKMIDTTEATSYVDAAELSGGKTYYYTVRACFGNLDEALSNKYDAIYWSHFNTSGLRATFIEVPEPTKATTASGGVKVQWEKSSGADGYAVYRRSGDGDWKMIGTTSSTSYTDKDGLKGSSSYEYTVRAYHGSSKTALANKYNALYWSGYDSSGITAVYHLSPTLSSVTGSGAGRKVSWKAVSGASGYAVYRKPSGGDWKMIDTTTETSYVETSDELSDGKSYDYTVRAYSCDEETAIQHKYDALYWSHFDSDGLSSTHLDIPTLVSATLEGDVAHVSWESVPAASGYAVYRKPLGGDWGMIATVSSPEFTVSHLDGCSYTVRAYIGSASTAKSHKYSSKYWSGFDNNGIEAQEEDIFTKGLRFIQGLLP